MRFLFVDRILQSIPGKSIRGLKHITSDDAYLACDEHGRMHFASSLIGETVGQLAAWNVMHYLDFQVRPVAGIVSRVVPKRLAYVGETLMLEANIDSVDEKAVEYHGIALINDEPIFMLEGAIGPMLPMEDFISREEVQLQYQQINRPGDWEGCAPILLENCLSEGRSSTVSMTFDGIVHSDPGVELIAVKYINFAAPYFAHHFPRKPVLPLTILLECKLNLIREFLKRANWGQSFIIQEMRRIKMKEFINPGDCVMCSLKVKSKDEHEIVLSYRTEVNGKLKCVMELVLK